MRWASSHLNGISLCVQITQEFKSRKYLSGVATLSGRYYRSDYIEPEAQLDRSLPEVLPLPKVFKNNTIIFKLNQINFTSQFNN